MYRVMHYLSLVLIVLGVIGVLCEPMTDATWIEISAWYLCSFSVLGIGYAIYLRTKKDNIQDLLDKDPTCPYKVESKKMEFKDFII